MAKNGIRIVATGRAVPDNVLSNADLEKIVDTSDEWIRERTGIKSRHKADKETATSMAAAAARSAIDRSGIDKSEIGACIVASSTPDQVMPCIACMVQKELMLPETIVAFDISVACTGFLAGLGVAAGLFNVIEKRYILIIGSEELSRVMDYTDRSTCIIFGDGAGAALVAPSDKPYFQKSWARGNEEFLYLAGLNKPNQFVSMQGTKVFKFAATAIRQGIDEVLRMAGADMESVDYVICHQANARIIDNVKKRYAGHEHKFFLNIAEYGNTSAASIPIALDEMMERGLLKEGMKIIMVAFGGGLAWSSVYMEI